MPTPSEWAWMAWCALAARLAWRFMRWLDRQGPPAPPGGPFAAADDPAEGPVGE